MKEIFESPGASSKRVRGCGERVSESGYFPDTEPSRPTKFVPSSVSVRPVFSSKCQSATGFPYIHLPGGDL